MKNRIEDLRNHLFETLVDSAKVEVAFLEATGGMGTGFIPMDRPEGTRSIDGRSPAAPAKLAAVSGSAGRGSR